MPTTEFELSRKDLFSFSKKHGGDGYVPKKSKHVSPSPLPNINPIKLGRRELLIAGLIAGAGIATTILEPWERVFVDSNPEIDQYYPELRSQTLRSKGEINTAKTTKWFNFAKTDFDPKIAQATLEFFENLAKQKPILSYQLDSQNIPFALGERPKTKRVIFIIPDSAPLPTSWDDPANEGSTTGKFADVYATFTRLHDSNSTIKPSPSFNNVTLAFNKIFSVEACQSSIAVWSTNAGLANLGQEIVANSYGSAFTAKQMLIPYPAYTAWAKGTQIRRDPQSPYYPLYVLSEKEYKEIPEVGFLTK